MELFFFEIIKKRVYFIPYSFLIFFLDFFFFQLTYRLQQTILFPFFSLFFLNPYLKIIQHLSDNLLYKTYKKSSTLLLSNYSIMRYRLDTIFLQLMTTFFSYFLFFFAKKTSKRPRKQRYDTNLFLT